MFPLALMLIPCLCVRLEMPVVMTHFGFCDCSQMRAVRALPLSALVTFLVRLMYFQSPPLLLFASVVEGILEVSVVGVQNQLDKPEFVGSESRCYHLRK